MMEYVHVLVYIGLLILLWMLTGVFINFMIRNIVWSLKVSEYDVKSYPSFTYIAAMKKGMFLWPVLNKFIHSFTNRPVFSQDETLFNKSLLLISSDGFEVLVSDSKGDTSLLLTHEFNRAVKTLRTFSPKSLEIECPDDHEFGLFKTLEKDGISVYRKPS